MLSLHFRSILQVVNKYACIRQIAYEERWHFWTIKNLATNDMYDIPNADKLKESEPLLKHLLDFKIQKNWWQIYFIFPF